MAEEQKKSVFKTLNEINVDKHIEKKNGLSYVSWAWAWQMVKEQYPDAQYKVYETENGINYFTDGRTCWVKTGVIVEGLEHIEYLPIMDNKNKSIPLEQVTSFDVNKSIQRSLTKALARHGLGLKVYAGEDLPDEVKDEPKEQEPVKVNEDIRKQAALFNVNLQKLAIYLSKPIYELTNQDVLDAIEKKRNRAGNNQ